MKSNDISKMSDDELRTLSIQKNKKGNATQRALRAQRELLYRNGGHPTGSPKPRYRGLTDEF